MNEIMMKPVCTNCGHIFKKVAQENERLDPLEGERTFLKLAMHSFYPQYCPECGMTIKILFIRNLLIVMIRLFIMMSQSKNIL